MYKNMVGLEAEFFLKDKDNNLVYPGDYGFETDDLIILGEVRALPGNDRASTTANFMNSWYKVVEKAAKNNLSVVLDSQFQRVTPQFYAELMRKIGNKNVAACKNIHNIDLLSLTDAEVEDGKILSYKISTGLHVHFSSLEVTEKFIKNTIEKYEKVKIPISFGNVPAAEMNFYQKISESDMEIKVVASASRITKPVLVYIVSEFDKQILPLYQCDVQLKYRNPGFYELKNYGFEYRSLPFYIQTWSNLYQIVDFAYSRLEELDL